MLSTTQRPTINLGLYQQSGPGTNYRGPCSKIARESVLSEYCGPDPVPLNTGERLAIPGEVRPKSPQKKGEWMSEVPLSKSVHDSALLKARHRNVLRLKKVNVRCQFVFPVWAGGSRGLPQSVGEVVVAVVGSVGAGLPSPESNTIIFNTSDEALAHNSKYLADCGWYLSELFRRNRGSTIDHGSKF